MNLVLSMLNDIAVSLFGSILSASFCNIFHTRKNRRIFLLCMAIIPFLQSQVYHLGDADFLRKIYPLIMHIPLILVLYLLSKKLLWSTISVLLAYLCCQLRRWIALMIVSLVHGGIILQDIIEISISLPLLFLLLHFVAPAARIIMAYPVKHQLIFGLIPALYYAFDYLAVVFTDLLISGSAVAVEFMPFVCCTAYLIFILYHSAEEQKTSQLQQLQKVLDIQLNQSVREINALRESQELTRRYRHDMRHHLQYLSACMESGQTEQAQTYISDIYTEIEAQTIQYYCENEAVNLILSSFAGRAKKDGIEIKVTGSLPASINITDSDLCVLLSNALENALHACQKLTSNDISRIIDIQFFKRNNKFFLQITNPCCQNVRFENGIPLSDKPNHGIGIQSICAIVRQYGGVCTFLLQNEQFVLRLSL